MLTIWPSSICASVPPKIVSGSAPERLVLAGDSFKLRCDANGYPEPSIRWTLNGEPLNATLNKHQHEFATRSRTALEILECVAENEAGVDTKEFIITTLSK